MQNKVKKNNVTYKIEQNPKGLIFIPLSIFSISFPPKKTGQHHIHQTVFHYPLQNQKKRRYNPTVEQRPLLYHTYFKKISYLF